MAKTKVVVRKSGFFGKLIALLLGILIGIVAGIGGLVGIVYFALTGFKISELFGFVEQATGDIPEEEYVGESYLDKTLLEAIMEASGVMSGVVSGSNTFGDLIEISPFVGTSISSLPDMLGGYGIKLTEEELLAMSVPDIAPFFQEQIGNIQIAPMLELLGSPVNPENVLMCAILYGEKDVHYTVVETDGTKTIEMRPLEYTYESGSFYDYQGTVYEANGSSWTTQDGSFTIKPEAATSEDGTISYLFALYKNVNETEVLEYRLAAKDGVESVYEAYANDEKQRHLGATVTTLASNDFMTTLENIAIGDLLSLDASADPLMLALAYGENGYKIQEGELIVTTAEPTTLKELTESGSTLAQDLKISTALGLDEKNASSIDTMMRAIAFGKEGVDYDVVNNEIVMREGKSAKRISDLDGDLIKTLTISDIIEINETEGEDKSPAILIALKATPVGDLSTKIDTLTLSDVIEDAENNQILKHLKDTPVTALSGKLAELTVQEVFADDVYKKAYYQTDGTTPLFVKNGNYYTDSACNNQYTGEVISYFVDKNGNHITYNESTKKYVLVSDGTTESAPVLTGTWKYLLSDHNGVEQVCLITDMAGLVDNMTDNMHYATLNELKADGILNISDETLNSDIIYEMTINKNGSSLGTVDVISPADRAQFGSKTKIGELSIEEILIYVDLMIKGIQNIHL